MHLKNITHRDIKPENIMHLKGNSYTLADYGIGMNLTYRAEYSEKD